MKVFRVKRIRNGVAVGSYLELLAVFMILECYICMRRLLIGQAWLAQAKSLVSMPVVIFVISSHLSFCLSKGECNV